jgi:CRISPR-associated protein Csm2
MGRPSAGGRGGNQDRLPQPNYEAIITNGNVDELVKAAQDIGGSIGQVKSSQIRGIFATVRQIQLNWSTDPRKAYRDAILLKPRIGYSASRNELHGLDQVLIDALGYVKGSDEERKARFMNFVDFFEAIVAYHKMQGGRN